MLKNLKISYDDEYEDMGMEFLARLTEMLSGVLEANGMMDRTQRKETCTQFLFELGNTLDQGSLKCGGANVHPVMCFLSGTNQDGLHTQPGVLNLPSQFFAYHEYAHSMVDDFFGEE